MGTKLFLSAALVSSLFGFEGKLKMRDLPAAVQKTVAEQTKGAELVGLSKEVEKGQTQYEVETKVNGKSRDLLIDPSGAVLSIEEITTLDAIPAPAQKAIQAKMGDGKLVRVETLTEGSKLSYEAVIQPKKGKKKEVKVSADGTVL